MIYKIVHYKMKAGHGETAVATLEDFIEGITKDEPETFYEAFRAEDGLSFVNMMVFRDESAEKFHQTAPHTQKFVEILYPNCEELPVFTNLIRVASTSSERRR